MAEPTAAHARELVDYLLIARRRWRWIVSGAVIGLALALVYLQLARPHLRVDGQGVGGRPALGQPGRGGPDERPDQPRHGGAARQVRRGGRGSREGYGHGDARAGEPGDHHGAGEHHGPQHHLPRADRRGGAERCPGLCGRVPPQPPDQRAGQAQRPGGPPAGRDRPADGEDHEAGDRHPQQQRARPAGRPGLPRGAAHRPELAAGAVPVRPRAREGRRSLPGLRQQRWRCDPRRRSIPTRC